MRLVPYGAVLLFLVLERIWPLTKRKMQAGELTENLFWLVFADFLFPAALATLSVLAFFTWADGLRLFQFHLNPMLEIVLILLLTDFVRYWGHRYSHRPGILWEIHKLHHSSQNVGVLSAYRSSWVEDLLFSNLFCWALVLVGFSADLVGLTGIVFCLQGQFVHSNLNLRFWKVQKVVADPHFHHWHHSSESHFANGQNFGVILSLWDKLFGTFYCPQNVALHYGFANEDEYPRHVLQRLVYPFDRLFLRLLRRLQGSRR